MIELGKEITINMQKLPPEELLDRPRNPELFNMLFRMTSRRLRNQPDKRKLNRVPQKGHAPNRNNLLMLRKMASWMR
jgi:hypothetical protein